MLKDYLSLLACDSVGTSGEYAFTALCLLGIGVSPREAMRAANTATPVRGDSPEFERAAYYEQAGLTRAVL